MSKTIRGVEHQKIQMIAENYNYSLSRVRDIEKHFKGSRFKDELIEFYVYYIKTVQNALKEFDPLELSILEREYFTPLQKGWWESLYSRATFYRLRLSATKKFLEVFNG